MKDPSRRKFLVVAGTTAAAAGVATAVPAKAAPATVPKGAEGPLVAYVRDARTGEISVMMGEREVVVHDRDLAARIARAAS